MLACGAHWPLGEDAARALARSGGTPTALHNNCSGKHAGFVCLACAMGVGPTGYVAPDHPVQREVTAAIEAMTGARSSEEMRGDRRLLIPTYAVPLIALARGFARRNRAGFGAERATPPRAFSPPSLRTRRCRRNEAASTPS